MKVKELIAELEQCDPEMEVSYNYPANDYRQNMLVISPRRIEPMSVVWSEYHTSWKVPDTDCGLGEDKNKEVIVID